MTPLPTIEGGWACVLADPAWNFVTYDKKSSVPTQAADPYETVPLEALKALPLADVCAKDCALIMWHSGTHTDQAIELGKAWGFRFIRSELFVWVKSREGYKPKLGMGYYSRNGAEVAALFTRGKPKVMDHGVEQVIFSPRGEHSAKPDQQYGLIERLFDGPRLEMFSRSVRPGWTSWGNEVGIRDGSLNFG